jgi:hypothetical protein
MADKMDVANVWRHRLHLATLETLLRAILDPRTVARSAIRLCNFRATKYAHQTPRSVIVYRRRDWPDPHTRLTI